MRSFATALSLLLLSLLSLYLVSAQTGAPTPVNLASVGDATVFNYALTLERLDSTFWTCYLYPLNTTNPACAYTNATYAFSQTDFANAGYNATVFQTVQLIAAEELAHATIINASLQALGYQPVPTCNYVYPNITSVINYLNQGLAFETVGTAAYAGGLNGISNPMNVQMAATIASVEARHAGYLSNLLGQQPFASSGFNQAYNGSQVAALIAPYYVNPQCLALTTLPTVRPYGVTGENSTDPTPFTGAQTNPSGFSYSAAARANDLKTLNYALILEDLEATFYAQAGTAFTAQQYAAAGYASTVPTYLSIIAQNEALHVAVLSSVISAYGGVPVTNCTYNFSALGGVNAFSSIGAYLNYASIIEGTGVSAYDGAANTLTDSYLLQVAATIAMIEARHVAFINTILYPNNQTQAVPQAVDVALTPLQVMQTVVQAGLITSCPFVNVSNLQAVSALLPQIAQPYPTSNTTSSTGAQPTGSTLSNYSSSTAQPLPVPSLINLSSTAGQSAASSTAGSSSSGQAVNNSAAITTSSTLLVAVTALAALSLVL